MSLKAAILASVYMTLLFSHIGPHSVGRCTLLKMLEYEPCSYMIMTQKRLERIAKAKGLVDLGTFDGPNTC
jgi:hypothetical protein